MKRVSIFLFLILFTLSTHAAELFRDFTNSTLYNTLETLSDDYYSLDLTDKEIDSLYNYALEDYKEINPALRRKDFKSLEALKEKVCSLDAAIEKYKTQGLTLYRGSRHISPGGDQVGFIFHENAFTSTSIDRAVGINFATSKAPYVLDIIKTDLTPVYGIWLNNLSDFDEEEILLARGTTFKVEAVEIQKFVDKNVIVRTLSIVDQRISSDIKNKFNCL